MTRLLFVDDERRVLDGLRQSLRGKRKIWEMVFAEGPDAALAEVGRGLFDVVISDMRMPGMDGAELLSRVAALQPQAARIVLSGQMDESVATRAAAVAHRFLAKPCDPETLQNTIARTLELRARLACDRVLVCLGGTLSLPSLPDACAALNRAIADEAAGVDAIARIIEKDVAMASKVLQLVNSSFFGLPRQMASVTQSVSYLGVYTIRNLVLAQSLFQAFGGPDLKDLEREQQHALLAAQIARLLLPDKRDAEAAATAALLHDIGVLALASKLPQEHREHVQLAARRKVPVHEIEREQLGLTHADVGAYLLGLWGLPHDVIEAVANHHGAWSNISVLDISGAVQFADAFAVSTGCSGELALRCGDPPPPELIERFGLLELLQKLRDQSPPSIARR